MTLRRPKILDRARRAKTVSYGPIGLDIASERMNLLQLKTEAGELSVHAAYSAPYPENREALLNNPKEFAAFVRQSLHEQPFKRRRVVTCLPAEQTQTYNISYSQHTGQGEEQALVEALHKVTDSDLSEMIIDYLPIRSHHKESHEKNVLAVAVRRDVVIGYLDKLHAAGLDVQALDLGPAAMRRLLSTSAPETTTLAVLLINFGRTHTCLTVIAGNRLLMYRKVDFCEELLLKRLRDGLNLKLGEDIKLLDHFGFIGSTASGDDQSVSAREREISETIDCLLKPLLLEFAEEVDKALIYTAAEMRGLSIEQVYLWGRMARYPGGEQMMTDLLSLPARILNPFDSFRTHAVNPGWLEPGYTTDFTLAAGMALRGMTTHE